MRKTIFHEKWWLDAIAPGRWREVVCVRGGQIVGSLPFEELSLGRLNICAMPQATHVLGPFLKIRPGKAELTSRSVQSIRQLVASGVDAPIRTRPACYDMVTRPKLQINALYFAHLCVPTNVI